MKQAVKVRHVQLPVRHIGSVRQPDELRGCENGLLKLGNGRDDGHAHVLHPAICVLDFLLEVCCRARGRKDSKIGMVVAVNVRQVNALDV